jgi:protein-tyrosine phosphatase
MAAGCHRTGRGLRAVVGDDGGVPVEPFRVLFVCTGNICRSPMAQSMLTAELGARLGTALGARPGTAPDGRQAFDVTSAGTYAVVGAPIEPDAARFLDSIGVRPAPEFVARALTEQQIESADLILGAERAHRAAAVTLVPRAVQRTFTIREFARLVAALPDGVEVPTDATTAERGCALVAAAGRNRGYVRADHPLDDDVADPYRMRYGAFEAAGQQIRAAVDVIASRLAPSAEHRAQDAGHGTQGA